ncbi:Serine/threonine-protein kinase rio2 [Ceratocystis platani]|uniref:Serine/threonine-protein kinase RIO2 n=1 Tax=Ceratocystis fimbriata f. sp. platani TaxID=88771 RepID=A0A0F8D4L5_CERFI|nr:Serine/threonine-protein kinase rio2 [Ceratocystis platani]
MLLDSKALRHLTSDDWRVLAAAEQGSKNHELVPTSLIEKLSRLRGGASGVRRSISALAKVGLIAKVKEAKYDGYRLTYGGLDYLALHTYTTRKEIYSVGSRIGVGKESDIMVVADQTGKQLVLKIHRLGRISFRTVKSNRDYLRNRSSASWMYLSRLAAMKEFAFMKALRAEGFPVPEPLGQSRHTVLMSLIDAFPLRQISSVPDPASLYSDLIDLLLRLAKHGLIHGDFNEFNILIKEEEVEGVDEEGQANLKLTPIIIDFPQMVSMDHQNAEMYFDRDVNCVKRYFKRRFGFTPTSRGPFFKDAKKLVGQDGATRLDIAEAASGFTKKMNRDLEAAVNQEATNESGNEEEDDDSDEYDSEYEGEGGEDEEDEEDEEEEEEAQPKPEGRQGAGEDTQEPKVGSKSILDGVKLEKLEIAD